MLAAAASDGHRPAERPKPAGPSSHRVALLWLAVAAYICMCLLYSKPFSRLRPPKCSEAAALAKGAAGGDGRP